MPHGSLDDGTAGLWTIKQLGGTAIVQDPGDAMYPGMPQHALRSRHVDYVVPLADLAALLVALTSAPIEARAAAHIPEQVAMEVKIAMEGNPIDLGLERLAKPSTFACPECHGVLLEFKEGP